MARKRALGRRKIPMKLILERSARHVTFSKRRSGLFKKASELSILTGANIACIVFSPGGVPFSFGHPSVKAIAKRVFNWGYPLNDRTSPQGANVSSLNQQLNDLVQQLDAEKIRGKTLQEELEKDGLLIRPLDQLNFSELKERKLALEELSLELAKHIHGPTLEGSGTQSSCANAPRLFDLNLDPPEKETSCSL